MKSFINSILTSSEDASKLSARIIGVLTAVSGYFVFFLGTQGVVISDGQAQAIVSQFAMAGGALYFVFGVIRYFVNTLGKKFLGEDFGW